MKRSPRNTKRHQTRQPFRPMNGLDLIPFDRYTFKDRETFLEITQGLFNLGHIGVALHLRLYAWENNRNGTVRAIAPCDPLPVPHELKMHPVLTVERVYLTGPDEGSRN